MRTYFRCLLPAFCFCLPDKLHPAALFLIDDFQQRLDLRVGKDICHARQSFRRTYAARLAAEYAFEHRRRNRRLHVARAARVCMILYRYKNQGKPEVRGLPATSYK